jgi:hypothetical protein
LFKCRAAPDDRHLTYRQPGKARSGEAKEATEHGRRLRAGKADAVARAHFYFSRSVARSELGGLAKRWPMEASHADSHRQVDQVLNNFRSTVALQYLQPESQNQPSTSTSKWPMRAGIRIARDFFLLLIGRFPTFISCSATWVARRLCAEECFALEECCRHPGLWRSWRKLAWQPRRCERKAI